MRNPTAVKCGKRVKRGGGGKEDISGGGVKKGENRIISFILNGAPALKLKIVCLIFENFP